MNTPSPQKIAIIADSLPRINSKEAKALDAVFDTSWSSKYDPLPEHKILVRHEPKSFHNPVCGHRTDLTHEPRHTSCQACWNTYFQVHPAELIAAKRAFADGRMWLLRGERGRKYVRAVKNILDAYEYMQAEQNKALVGGEPLNISDEERAKLPMLPPANGEQAVVGVSDVPAVQ